MENIYHYSESYIYKGKDTICELFGTDEEKQKQAIEICELLNNKIKINLFYFSLGLIFSLVIVLISIF